MLNLFKLIKTQSPVVRQSVRYAHVKWITRLFKKPLDPEIDAFYERYKHTWFYSSFIDGHREYTNKLDMYLIRKQAREEELRAPIPATFSHLNASIAETDDVKQTDFDLLSNARKSEIVNPRLAQRNMIAAKVTEIDDTKKEILEGMTELRKGLLAAKPDPYDYHNYTADWMLEYETYDETVHDLTEKPQYGTPDPTIPVSKVPCHGCGSQLHCADPGLPGYLPSEIMAGQPDDVLRNLNCQRCHFLINYNTAINLKVDPKDYVSMLGTVKDKMAVIILMVDLLDLPSSIWPKMVKLIGKKQPIVLVGNKVDMLPKDSKDYLQHVKSRLKDSAVDAGIPAGNIKHTCLISARTSYGIEELITRLHLLWRYKGDVYLMGCTNVGKSTLFNALLRSDYCSVKASSLIKRATASIWPGTTLKMLKFPILRPTEKVLFERSLRLKNEHRKQSEEARLLARQTSKANPIEPEMLIGHIGQTFIADGNQNGDEFALKQIPSSSAKYVSETRSEYAQSRWCFDTPGVIQPDQIINLLTTEELLLVIPKKVMIPRSYHIPPKMTILLAGLGRLDYVSGPGGIKLNLFASEQLPVMIVETALADQIHTECLGSKMLAVPMGDAERLNRFPKLQKPYEPIVVVGNKQEHVACADIVLSSAGWISVELPPLQEATFDAYTPECRGIYVRQPALLPLAGTLYRGKRIRGTPAYETRIPSNEKIYATSMGSCL